MQNYSQTRLLLEDTYNSLSRSKGLHAVKDGGEIVADDAAFNLYVNSLSEGLPPHLEGTFRILAEQTRKAILETTTLQAINTPYNYLLLPLLRIFFPKLVSTNIVTVDTMNEPFVIKYFLQATAVLQNGSQLNLPDYSGLASSGPQVPVNTSFSIAASGGTINLITAAGVTATAGIQHNATIVSATASSLSQTVALNFMPDNTTGAGVLNITYNNGVVDSFEVAFNYVTGQVNVYLLKTTNAGGQPLTTSMAVAGTVGLDNNENITVINPVLQPFEFSAVSRTLRTQWSIQLEQDIKALMDLDLQATMLELLGSQIAVDIDKEIIGDIILTAQTLNPNNQQTFSKTVPSGFALGPKQWFENIVNSLNLVSSQIYTDTAIDIGNILLCNNLDATILQNTGFYSKTGNMVGDSDYTGTTPFKVGDLANSWKVFSTPLCPQGQMVVLLKSPDPAAAVYLYAMYKPITIYPWPLGNVPNLTFLSRYAKKALRPKGIGLVNVTA